MKLGIILYIVAAILVIGWLIGYIGFGFNRAIHSLLIMAAVAVVLNIISTPRDKWY